MDRTATSTYTTIDTHELRTSMLATTRILVSKLATVRVFCYPPTTPNSLTAPSLSPRDLSVPTISSDKGSDISPNASDSGNIERLIGAWMGLVFLLCTHQIFILLYWLLSQCISLALKNWLFFTFFFPRRGARALGRVYYIILLLVLIVLAQHKVSTRKQSMVKVP